ncbi:MAG: serine hydrolase domain-containing protein, partial [Pseudomonadota bacterium]
MPAPRASTQETAASTAFSRYSSEDEATYRARFEQLRQSRGAVGTGLSAYDPVEIVEGSKDPKSLPLRPTGAFSQDALGRAEQFAALRNSSTLLIWRDGQLEHEKYFGEFASETLQVSRSLSKPLTAILIGRALMQGHIRSLDQPVSDYITEWQGDPERQSMRIRHLLDMRSGMLRQRFALEPESVLNRAYLHPRHDEVIIHDYPMTHAPGTR